MNYQMNLLKDLKNIKKNKGDNMNMTIMNETDLTIMKLLHYFITRQNYSPIIIKGIEDEIWLENKNNEYSIIRIVTRHIHNDEQYKYDLSKTKHISKQIKRKLLDLSMNMLTIYTDIGYVTDIQKTDSKYFDNIVITKDEDILENELLNKKYKNIKEAINFEEKDFELIGKMTKEISEKNIEVSEKREKLMKNKKPILTYMLIIINIIIFILMYVFGNGSENTKTLIDFGANYIPYVKNGEYYRLITSAFLHIGAFHLIVNMYSLYVVGTQIEYIYGKVKYFFIYIISAIMGSLFTVVLSDSNVVAAGASGAIFGLLGSLLYFGYNYRGYFGNQIINQVLPVIVLNLLIGFSSPNIGNAAHIGGLIGGYIISMALGADIKEDGKNRINGIIITIILTIVMIYLGFFS